jgi:hypothetical protein
MLRELVVFRLSDTSGTYLPDRIRESVHTSSGIKEIVKILTTAKWSVLRLGFQEPPMLVLAPIQAAVISHLSSTSQFEIAFSLSHLCARQH